MVSPCSLCPWACRVLPTRKAIASGRRSGGSSSRTPATTDSARLNTAGAKCSLAARCSRGSAGRVCARQTWRMICSRCGLGGTGSSMTMSKRRMKALSSPCTELVIQMVGTVFSSSILFTQDLLSTPAS